MNKMTFPHTEVSENGIRIAIHGNLDYVQNANVNDIGIGVEFVIHVTHREHYIQYRGHHHSFENNIESIIYTFIVYANEEGEYLETDCKVVFIIEDKQKVGRFKFLMCAGEQREKEEFSLLLIDINILLNTKTLCTYQKTDTTI